MTKTQIRIRTTAAQVVVGVLLILGLLALTGCGVRTHPSTALPFVPGDKIQGVAIIDTASCYLAAVDKLEVADTDLFLAYGQLLAALSKDIAGDITGSTDSINEAADSLDRYGAGWAAALAAVDACPGGEHTP